MQKRLVISKHLETEGGKVIGTLTHAVQILPLAFCKVLPLLSF